MLGFLHVQLCVQYRIPVQHQVINDYTVLYKIMTDDIGDLMFMISEMSNE